MADIGTVYVRVAPNMTGIQGKIAAGFKGAAGPATAALGDEVDKNSGPFQSALGKLGGFAKGAGVAIGAGMMAGAAGIVALTGKMLQSGAELEQQLGGSEAVFGEFAKSIQDQAKTAYSQAGLSQNEFLQGANKMGSLFQGAGFDVQSSMKMSGESMQRASDIASIMGISTTDALDAVTGMAKGNFTMMDNLGVAMNDTAIGAYAVSKGINTSTTAMSIQEKVGLAQQMFMEKTAKYAGNYAKENDTLSGSINTTKKAFDNFMSGGGDIGDFITSLVSTIKIAVPKIVEILPKLVSGISSVLQALVPALSAALPVLIPALITAVQGLINALITALPTIIQSILIALPMFISAFIQLFLALVQALPQIIQIIAAAIPQVIDAIVNGLTNPEALTAIIMGAIQLFLAIIEALPTIIVALVNALPVIIENIIKTLTSPEFIKMMIDATITLFMALVKAIPQIIGALIGALGTIATTIVDTLSKIDLVKVGGDLVKGLWNGINDLGGWVIDKIKGFGQGILDGIKGFFGIHSPSTVFAGIGENLNKGLAQGLDSSAGLVTKSMNSMTDDALSAVISPMVSSNVAFGGGAGVSAGGNTNNSTTQTVSIQTVALGDASAVKEFFKQLGQDTISVGMGMTPVQGAQ
jgi:phage-related protein